MLIAGGGIAGLETLLALHDLASGSLAITLVAPDPEFTYKPLTVEEPFSLQPAESHELAPVVEQHGAEFVRGAVAAVDPSSHDVELDDGSRIGYDVAVMCVGGRTRPAFERAINFRSAADRVRIAEMLAESARDDTRRVAFVVPPGGGWPLPIYELALLARRRANDLGREMECVVVTPEQAPLIVFGTAPSQAVADLLELRGIEVHAGVRAHETEDGDLVLEPGGQRVNATDVVALPLLDGPAIPGLPADEGGFIPIDEHARVKGADDLYAAGDGTNFPIKQGGIGTQQADAAAEHIAARFGASLDPQPFHPVLRGMLLTGGESLHMAHSLTGGEGEGEASADYLWWPPHKVSGRYLAAWLGHTTAHRDPEPPWRPLEVEVALPKEWHEEPMALDPHRPPGG